LNNILHLELVFVLLMH